MIFSRGDALVFFKGSYKVAEVVKAAVEGHFGDGFLGGCQLVAGVFDPLIIQIIDGRPVRHLIEKAAEIFGRHGSRGGKLFQRDLRGIVVVDVFQHIFQLHDPLVIFSGLGNILQIQMFGKNRAEKMVELSERGQLIAGTFGSHGIENIPDDLMNFLIFGEKVMVDQGGPVNNFLDIGRAAGIVLQKSVQIEHQTFVNAVCRRAGMQNAAVDENNIPGGRSEFFFVKGHVKFALQYPDDLIFHMPVIIHNVTRISAVYMVKFERKAGSPVLFCLIKV